MAKQTVPFVVSAEGTGVAQTLTVAGDSQHVFTADTYPSFGGQDSAPSPLAYALGALTSCHQVTGSIVAKDLGLGRVRTLSVEGRDAAAERWYDGDGGPEAPVAKSAPDSCHTCGFLIRIAGPLAETFGVCANGDANADGRIVSFDHGCGAHSEVRLAKRHEPLPMPEPVFDTLSLDEIDRL